MVVMTRQGHLLEVVHRPNACRRASDLLDGRQQQGDQKREDADDHQHLEEGKPAAAVVSGPTHDSPPATPLPGSALPLFSFRRLPCRRDPTEREFRYAYSMPGEPTP